MLIESNAQAIRTPESSAAAKKNAPLPHPTLPLLPLSLSDLGQPVKVHPTVTTSNQQRRTGGAGPQKKRKESSQTPFAHKVESKTSQEKTQIALECVQIHTGFAAMVIKITARVRLKLNTAQRETSVRGIKVKPVVGTLSTEDRRVCEKGCN